MIDRKQTLVGGLAAALLLSAGLLQAALVPQTLGGVDVVCDNDYTPFGASSPGLIWTKDANLAESNTFGLSTGVDLGLYPGDVSGVQGRINADGTMNWPGARFWIDAMNAANYGGVNDWRLWSALNSDGSGPCGPAFNCTESELGHLFYTEGGLSPGNPITNSAALDVFTNMQDSVYWSGTEFASNPNGAWRFRTNDGRQFSVNKDVQDYVWAVRPGQCRAAPPGPQPIPAVGAWGLALLGLMLVGVARARLR